MHYVYLSNNVVTDECQVDPSTIFSSSYAANFIEAPDEVTSGWTLVDGNWNAPAIETPNDEWHNKFKAQQLLQETDWTQISDVDLVNKSDFTAYRAQLRSIVLNPQATVESWPIKPEEIWPNA